MKLVFPGGEHPQVLLGPGINRIGSDPGANIVLNRPGVMPQHCQLHVTTGGVMLARATPTWSAGAVRICLPVWAGARTLIRSPREQGCGAA